MPESSNDLQTDYETLAPTHSVFVHMSAGALAGVAEHVVMLPIDSVKTRVQSLCPCDIYKCPTPIHGIASVMKQEGWMQPLRGVGAVAAGTIPAHALYFTVYERIKSILTNNTYGHVNTLSYGVAGTCSTLVHDFIMNPAEVVKQRMQMKYSPYGGSLECARCIYRTEGVSAFYRSYTIQLASNVPYQAVHFMSYEFLQQLLNPEHKYDPKTHLLAGGLAGGLAAALTIPFDCIKTVLNTQQAPELDQRRLLLKTTYSYSGVVDAVRSIYLSRGLGGFMRGCQARVLYQMPGTALSWSVYEFFKFLFS